MLNNSNPYAAMAINIRITIREALFDRYLHILSRYKSIIAPKESNVFVFCSSIFSQLFSFLFLSAMVHLFKF